MNLVQEHGYGYFNDRFRDSVFRHPDGWVGIVKQANNANDVTITKVEGVVGRLSPTEVVIEAAFFTSLAVFDVPEVGYRTAAEGRYVAYVDHRSGSNRGVSARNTTWSMSPMTEQMGFDRAVSISYFGRADVKAALICTPIYTQLHKGAAAMLAGEIAGFALSSATAVTATDNPEMGLIYLRGRAAGTLNLSTLEISTTISNLSLALGVAA